VTLTPSLWMVFFSISALACAQDIITRGADVFAKTCATPYCHGPKGAGGGAPKLAARGFDEIYIASVTRAGVAGTSMQGYGSTLQRADFNAVIAYVASLSGVEPRGAAPSSGETVARLSPEAARGRDLFFDSVRGVDRCSTCHQVQGLGIGVAPIANIPATAAALRNAATPDVRTAHVGVDHFPALIVSVGGRRTVLYDLTTSPPVMRTVESAAVRIADNNEWRHAAVVKSYDDRELESILAFLRSALPTAPPASPPATLPAGVRPKPRP
jgi:mono/diheme cytochrome c family protein